MADRYLERIQSFYSPRGRIISCIGVCRVCGHGFAVREVTSSRDDSEKFNKRQSDITPSVAQVREPAIVEGSIKHSNRLNLDFRFDNFVEGKSNQLARAAAQRVSEKPGLNTILSFFMEILARENASDACCREQICSHNPKAKIFMCTLSGLLRIWLKRCS